MAACVGVKWKRHSRPTCRVGGTLTSLILGRIAAGAVNCYRRSSVSSVCVCLLAALVRAAKRPNPSNDVNVNVNANQKF